MQCGICTGSCPLSSKSKINPRKLMLELSYMLSPSTISPQPNIYQKNEVWDCTTCSTCSNRCPREVKPMDVFIGLRNLFVEQGQVPRTLIDALEGVIKYGNPWGLSRNARSDWARDLKVKYVSDGEKVELLYFVGCAASYESRAQNVARAIVKTLNMLGTDFSLLGNQESCCGNEVYSIGEKGLFEELVESNSDLFSQYGIEKIITTSPHCFHAFKNRYRKEIQVKHYTQHFADLLDSGKLKLSARIEKVITYQDPCFLGKHNGIYEEPRKILESISGAKFVEMSRSKARSVCCEGGGGRMWHDIPGPRLAEKRIKDALDAGAEIMAVACPFCLLTFDDAIKTTGNEEKIQVRDIMELIADAL
jgi:Fe-S oxidoreductase